MSKIWKKLLAVALTASISAGAAVAGTVAYLQDTDEDVNVMTLGSVKIAQHEKERVDMTQQSKTEAAELRDFTQRQPLYPAVLDMDGKEADDPQAWAPGGGSGALEDHYVNWGNFVTADVAEGSSAWNGVWGTSLHNVIDKFVFVENTGKSDAYYRTLILLECDETQTKNSYNQSMIHYNFNGNSLFDWKRDFGTVTVNDEVYEVLVATYKNPLKPGTVSRPSLLQVGLDGEATNEIVEQFGDTYDILALSQAVQTAGFDSAADALNAAFGEVTEENIKAWFEAIPEGFEVSNSEELAGAIAAGETEIWLNPGTYTAPAAAKGKTLTINGTKDAVLEVVPGGQSEAGGQLDYAFDGSKVTFNGVTIKTNSQLYAGYARLSGTYNNCVIQNTYNLGTGYSAFYNCEFNITNEYLRVGGASTAVFDGCTFNTDGRAILVFQDGTNVAQTVTVKDCTFNATAAANTWNGIHVAAVSIDGTNGTYTVNLEGTNTVDSDFNGLWQIKAGEANVTVND